MSVDEESPWSNIEKGDILAIRIEDGKDYWDCIVEVIAFPTKHIGSFPEVKEFRRLVVINKLYNWSSLYQRTSTDVLGESVFVIDTATITKVEKLSYPKPIESIKVKGVDYVKPSWLSF